jgi:hypothetical protein
VIFVLAPMISFATTNADNKTPKLKSFLHPNFVPINPGVLDDPAIDISKNDNTVGHYEVALNLNYREACMFNLNFHQILNQDNYLLNETEYVIEYEPNFYFSNNNEVVSINDGVSFNNITREFKIGINAGPQTVYPVFGTHQYYFNFSIFANGYHTYTNMVYLTLNITKGKFINELTINSPTIEGVVLSEQTYTDASLHQYREVLTINKTSLNADTINFQEK